LFKRVRNAKFTRVYNTPEGLYPSITPIAMRFGVSRGAIQRRLLNTDPTHKGWFVIHNPTKSQAEQAICNVEDLLLSKPHPEDDCELCNLVDDMIFSERCWLLQVDHDHTETTVNTNNVVIHYAFQRKDYEVSYSGWVNGERPHLNKEM
jgi:hypothetical protein